MYMIGFRDRGAGGANSPPAVSTPSPSTPAHFEGARLSPSAKRDANIAEPRRLGGPILYAMGVFNPCLLSHSAIWTGEADAGSPGRGRASRARAGHLDDASLSPVDQDLRDRFRQRDDVLFLQSIRRVNPRERGQVLEDMDEDVIPQRRPYNDALRIGGANHFHALRLFFLGGRCLGFVCRSWWGPLCTERRSSERIRAGFLQECDDLIEQHAFLRRQIRHFEIGEHTSELQSHLNLVCRLLLEKNKKKNNPKNKEKKKKKKQQPKKTITN